MKHSNLQSAKTVIKNNFLYYYIIYNYNIIMTISSTGIYGNTSILNSEIYTDIINDIEDINTNKIPNLILDISENTSAINDKWY